MKRPYNKQLSHYNDNPYKKEYCTSKPKPKKPKLKKAPLDLEHQKEPVANTTYTAFKLDNPNLIVIEEVVTKTAPFKKISEHIQNHKEEMTKTLAWNLGGLLHDKFMLNVSTAIWKATTATSPPSGAIEPERWELLYKRMFTRTPTIEEKAAEFLEGKEPTQETMVAFAKKLLEEQAIKHERNREMQNRNTELWRNRYYDIAGHNMELREAMRTLQAQLGELQSQLDKHVTIRASITASTVPNTRFFRDEND
jgi:hypothetical protein